MSVNPAPSPQERRLNLARRIGSGYAANRKAAVVMVSGSTGRGTADKYSDLELDVYWREPPTADERRAAALACGAEAVECFPYEEREWAEEITVEGFTVGTSTFLVSTMERYIAEVCVEGKPDSLAQMRLYAVQHAQVLFGDEHLVNDWRARIADYPPALAHAVLRQNLDFEGFGHAEDGMAARDDVVLLYDTLTKVARQALGALLAVNGLYLPNPDFKRVDELIAEMQHKPPDLLRRLKSAYRLPPAEGVAVMHALAMEVLELVDRHVPGFPTWRYKDRLKQRRAVWE
jgi:hypothetical protein